MGLSELRLNLYRSLELPFRVLEPALAQERQAQPVHGLERIRPESQDLAIIRYSLGQLRFAGIHVAQFEQGVRVVRNYLDHSLPLPLRAGKIARGFQQESQAMMQQPVVASTLQRITVDSERPSQPCPIRLAVQVGEKSRPALDQFSVVELFRKRRLMRSAP